MKKLLTVLVSAFILSGCSNTYEYRDVSVWESEVLLPEASRGRAYGYVIVHRKPNEYGMVCSSTGCKSLERVLKHEYQHILQYRENGLLGVYKYLVDEEYKQEMENEAKEAEFK